MRKGLLNPKYIRIGVRISLIIREVIRKGQIVGTGGQYTSSRPRQDYRDSNFRRNTRGYDSKIIEGDIEMIGIVITIEVGTDQEKEHSQEIIVMVETEVQVTVDQDQDLELVQIERG